MIKLYRRHLWSNKGSYSGPTQSVGSDHCSFRERMGHSIVIHADLRSKCVIWASSRLIEFHVPLLQMKVYFATILNRNEGWMMGSALASAHNRKIFSQFPVSYSKNPALSNVNLIYVIKHPEAIYEQAFAGQIFLHRYVAPLEVTNCNFTYGRQLNILSYRNSNIFLKILLHSLKDR